MSKEEPSIYDLIERTSWFVETYHDYIRGGQEVYLKEADQFYQEGPTYRLVRVEDGETKQ